MTWYMSPTQPLDDRQLIRWCSLNSKLVMFFEDIRTERLLMRQVADRLSVRWYVGYDLDEPLPDHSTLSKIRTRYGLEVFRRFFEAIVEQCQQARLVWGKELYFDATQIEANADLDSLAPRFAVEARETIREHLTALFASESPRLRKSKKSTWTLLFSNPLALQIPFCFPHSFPRRSARRLLPTTRLATIGSLKRGSLNEKSMALLSGQRI